METTFISIHDLSLDARLLYVSSSVEDILGYHPQDLVGRSCWEFFHPDELPFARSVHGRSIQLDKAAVLNYCQIKNRQGVWIGCECVFTIVHDVLVASTSVYRSGPGSQRRAIEAPVIRQLFSSSPRDPRYHMLSYISHKFSQETRTHVNEPRAALFLNRFSRTLAIMYATNGLAEVLGIPAERLIGKSFYFCIQENCLREAVKCLESAKANDSIAYLRFWFRDPTQDSEADQDERMSDGQSTIDDDDGGVHLVDLVDQDSCGKPLSTETPNSLRSSAEPRSLQSRSIEHSSRSPSGNSTDLDGNTNEALFDQPAGIQSSTSSVSTPDEMQAQRQPWGPERPQIELEAVVSCTSDGLVVVLRPARPFIPHVSQPTNEPTKSPYKNGFFASPWASHPILPDLKERSNPQPDGVPPAQFPIHPTAVQANTAATMGPSSEDFMNSIREVAVFAWSLIGINGSLVKYSRGTPSGESQPSTGLPIWDPYSNAGLERRRERPQPTSRYRYSYEDGTPMYEQMDVEMDSHGANAHDQVNGRTQEHRFTSPAPSNGFYNAGSNNAVYKEHQTNGQGRFLEQSSCLSNSVATRANPYHNTNGSLQGPTGNVPGHSDSSTRGNPPPYSQGVANGFSMGNHNRAEHTTMSNGNVQSNGQTHRTQSHDSEYDPFAPGAYDPSRAGLNTSSVQQAQVTAPVGSQWNTNQDSRRQVVSGYPY